MEQHYRAIEQLVYAYAERIDAGDFAGLAELLARAVVKAGGAVLAERDRDAVLALYTRTTRLYDDGTPHTKHLVSNLQIDLRPDARSATACSYFTVLQSLPDFPLQPIIAGRYLDRFAFDDGGWHFVEREIVSELSGDLSRHLLIDPPRPGGSS